MQAVLEGDRLETAIAKFCTQGLDGRDRALARELASGTVRWYILLKAQLEPLLAKRLKDPMLEALLSLGLYQINFTRIPPHAAVSTSVELAKRVKLGRAAGLVNGVLRRFIREQETIIATELPKAMQAACPGWLAAELEATFGDAWVSVAQAMNGRAPYSLRVNSQFISRDAFVEQLCSEEIECQSGSTARHAVTLATSCDPTQLPGFESGHFVVQDEASQLISEVVNPGAGQRILDACAAPGGKSMALADAMPSLTLVAVESDSERTQRMRENFERTQVQARIVVGDAAKPSDWWDQRPFDRIVVDAPCTATGIIRRHPDIKLRRRKGDPQRFAATQLALLEALWPLLEESGELIYCTCSVLRTENDNVVERFTSNNKSAKVLTINAQWGTATTHGRQITPGEAGMDGFYYARLGKG